MYKNMTIKFSIHPYRRYKPSNFNPKLSKYWSDLHYGQFKKW